MTKRFFITSLAATVVVVASSLSAEAREFRYFNQKTELSANPTNPKPEIRAVKISDKKQKSATSSVVVATSKSATSKSVYAALLNEQTLLSDQIGVLSAQLQGASRGQAKKLSAQINDLTEKLNSIERRIASFPESIKNPGQAIVEVDEQFNRQMDSLAAQLNAATDPFSGKISSDPELEAIYRQYLRENGISNGGQAIDGADGLTYRVMIAISKNSLPKSAFAGIDNVLEQRMADGGVIYYQGSYYSKSEAEKACNEILSQRKFRDAFVVAMQGERRVPIK